MKIKVQILKKFLSFIARSSLILAAIALILSLILGEDAIANDRDAFKDPTVCAAYLTGIGCSNCAVIDPVLFQELVLKYPDLVILEYEIYHKGNDNQGVKDDYFKAYNSGQPGGVPFFILGKDKTAMGRIKVAELLSGMEAIPPAACPMPNGASIEFSKLDLSQLRGKVSIWTKNRVLIAQGGSSLDNAALHKLLAEPNIWKILPRVRHEKIEPFPIEISQGMIFFANAIKVSGWILQWNDDPRVLATRSSVDLSGVMTWFFPVLMLVLLVLAFIKIERVPTGIRLRISVPERRRKDYFIVVGTVCCLLGFFILIKALDPSAVERAGYYLPLPLFTFIIGFVDGFNPCNMFVLTCMMALLVSTSGSRVRLYIVGLSFVATVFILYFLFMAAWLNVFQYISFISPLRIGIGILSLVAGIINCKDFLFFKQGVSLTIPDSQRGPLMKKVYAMKKVIQTGSYPVLILSAIALAVLSSLVEIPCTAGFPIIYTGILSGKVLESTMSYYLYLAFYNLLYVFPLLMIISIFIVSFKGQPISQRQMEILKFIGGVIMIVLGIILLVNPGLVGISIA